MSNISLHLVPVIAVFTKYDKLFTREKRKLKKAPPRTDLTCEEIDYLAEDNANTQLQIKCIKPFEKYVDRMVVPHVTVSSGSRFFAFSNPSLTIRSWLLARPQYAASLAELMQVTYENVDNYFVDASVMSAIAQKVNPRVKIRASIE